MPGFHKNFRTFDGQELPEKSPFQIQREKLATKNPKKIREAIIYFESVPEDSNLYAAAQYHLAHAALLIGDANSAESKFDEFVNQFPSDEAKSAAEFFHAVTKIILNKKQEAIDILNEDIIKVEDHPYKGLALQIKKRLNN